MNGARMSGANDIEGMRCVRPAGAFYAFPNISGTGFDAKTLQDRCIGGSRGRDCRNALCARRGLSAHFLRGSVENIERAMARIKSWLGDNMSA